MSVIGWKCPWVWITLYKVHVDTFSPTLDVCSLVYYCPGLWGWGGFQTDLERKHIGQRKIPEIIWYSFQCKKKKPTSLSTLKENFHNWLKKKKINLVRKWEYFTNACKISCFMVDNNWVTSCERVDTESGQILI